MSTRKSSAELEADRLDLLDEAEALAQLREGDDARDLTDEEQARFDEITGDEGLAAAKQSEVDKARQFEVNRDRVRRERLDAERNVHQQPGRGVEPPKKQEPRVSVKGHRTRHFKDDRTAYCAGQWFAYAMSPSSDVRKHHQDELIRLGGDAWKEYAAQSIGTDGKGGYLVPEPISTAILKHRDDVGVLPRVANVIPMESETLRFNEETGDTTVYYPGESTAITESDVDWTQHLLTVKKRAALVKMSREFIRDSNIAAADQIVDNLAFRFQHALDNEGLNGDGTATYGSETGLIPAAGSAGVNTAESGIDTLAELSESDFTDTISTCPGRYHNSAVWIMSREVWSGACLRIMSESGGNTFMTMQQGSTQPLWMGYPVYFSDLMPAAAADAVVALFGDFRRAVVIGDRNDMSIETSTERYFETDDVAIRATHRYDILVHKPGDGSAAGAYSALQLAAS